MYLKDYSHRSEGWVAVGGVGAIHTLAFWLRQDLGEQNLAYSLNGDVTRYSRLPDCINIF